MTKPEMEHEIMLLKGKKGELINTKTSIQNKLAEINSCFVGRLDNRTYEKLSKERAKYCGMFNDIEQKMQNVNDAIRKLSVEKTQTPKDSAGVKPTIQALVAIRDEYQQFAADRTRVASMRQMASEFVVKLNPIIRKAVGET